MEWSLYLCSNFGNHQPESLICCKKLQAKHRDKRADKD